MPAPSKRSQDKFWLRTQRVIHRRVRVAAAGGAGTAAGSEFVPAGAGRLTHIGVDYEATAPGATTDLTIIADPTDVTAGTGGVTLFTNTNSATDIPFRALGQPNAVDEGRAVTAATDATDGGAFFKAGLLVSIAQTNVLAEAVVVDLFYERMRYEVVTLISQSGADASGAATRSLDLNGAGRLAGLRMTFANQPVTTDVTIRDSDSSGTTLFTSTDSATNFIGAVGIIGVDEANGALAATDGSVGGQPFRRGLHFTLGGADAFTSSNETVTVECWIVQ